ncbi:MAG TPA: mevalonate kinase [Bacteroidia bacterium]|nr:mevalonate kinase [Bacteroidia bacterium]
MKESLFYAKILLFGEYGIIEDSMGLSIPYNFYRGKMSFDGSENPELAAKSNNDLREFHAYLKGLHKSKALIADLDLDALEDDINKGLYFDSSIPQGYGVGSSGALVAAVYERYAVSKVVAKDNSDRKDMLALKSIFSQMESYFHGKSSGLDPLICYLNIPILIKSKTDLDTVGLPGNEAQGQGAIFLLDTGETGETQPLVNWFLEQCKQDGFRSMVRKQLKRYNDECIQAFLKGHYKPLFGSLKHLSKLLLRHFQPMIPPVFHKLWKDGIESNAYYLKLCGSGGGGFILGFTQNFETAKEKLKGYNLEVIHRF